MGEGHVLALKTDGTVLAAGDNSNEQCDVSGWTDIIAVYAQKNTSFGLRADGTVVTAGPLENGMEKIKTWRDMKMLAFGTYDKKPFALGVKRDGSLSVVGDRLTTLLASKRAAGKDLIWKEKNRFVAAGENILFGGICDVSRKNASIAAVIFPFSERNARTAARSRTTKEEQTVWQESDYMVRICVLSVCAAC